MIYISFDIGIKNLALCILKKTDEEITILDWRIISLADKKKDIKGIDDIAERIYMELDNIIGYLKEREINEIDYVLIENQPSNLNGMMKTIQYIIYCYFSLLKYWDKIIENVVLVNASLKTKTHEYKPDIQIKMEETKEIKVAGTIATALNQGIKMPMINIPPKGAVKQLKLLGIISTMLRSCTKTSMP